MMREGIELTVKKRRYLEGGAILLGILTLAAVEFIMHRSVPFMMDDNWYATNLVTGETLQDFGDILESQYWHFMNWGGRCVTHGLLQVILMGPEWVADLCNLGMTLLLAFMICLLAGRKDPLWYLCALSMLVSLNANCKMSMFWQSGTVNYVYASVWILVFLWVYLRQVEDPATKRLPLVGIWILPLGLAAGWSNENMGPVCFLLAAASLFWVRRKGGKPGHWMWEGLAAAFLGSMLVIAAPGNFVRNAFIPKAGFPENVLERLLSMLTAGAEYLFPSFLLLTLTMLFYLVCERGKLGAAQWFLFLAVVLSYGAMVLSPHYPDRATFGTMVLCIILVLWMSAELMKRHGEAKRYMEMLTFCSWFAAVYSLLREMF